jgi:hypothetical protein
MRHAVIARAAGLPLERGSGSASSGVAVANPLDDDASVGLSPKYTQDYSSPRRKVRSLAAAAVEKSKNKSSRATVSVQRSEDIEGEAETEEPETEELTIPRESKVFDRTAGEGYQEKSGSDGDDELAIPKRPARNQDGFDTTKLIGGSSPKALKASKRLLLLASPHPEAMRLETRETKETKLITSPLVSPEPSSTSSTPKPAFLRRLDSPQSHHGKLLVAKTKLTNMLTQSLRLLPKLKAESFEEVKKALLRAVTKLESGTVSP